jgi:hypothetical protein
MTKINDSQVRSSGDQPVISSTDPLGAKDLELQYVKNQTVLWLYRLLNNQAIDIDNQFLDLVAWCSGEDFKGVILELLHELTGGKGSHKHEECVEDIKKLLPVTKSRRASRLTDLIDDFEFIKEPLSGIICRRLLKQSSLISLLKSGKTEIVQPEESFTLENMPYNFLRARQCLADLFGLDNCAQILSEFFIIATHTT